MFRRVVTGIDGHEGGRDALALAHWLAPGATLVLVGAYPYDARGLASSRMGALMRDTTVATLERERADAGVSAELAAVADHSPARALHGEAERRGADLIVVGAAHHGALGRVLLGDVGRAVLRNAPCPVAVAPRGFRPRSPHTVGVGFDGSPESRAALSAAQDLARGLGARLRIIVVAVRGKDAPPPYSAWPAYVAAVRENADETARAAAEIAGPDAETEVRSGLPGEQLAEASSALDVLVVGSRGWGPVMRLVLGSTSDAVVHRARCPVVVVPRPVAAEPVAGEAVSVRAIA
jgi:nucleotide-binding universal stress UspA family protein